MWQRCTQKICHHAFGSHYFGVQPCCVDLAPYLPSSLITHSVWHSCWGLYTWHSQFLWNINGVDCFVCINSTTCSINHPTNFIYCLCQSTLLTLKWYNTYHTAHNQTNCSVCCNTREVYGVKKKKLSFMSLSHCKISINIFFNSEPAIVFLVVSQGEICETCQRWSDISLR